MEKLVERARVEAPEVTCKNLGTNDITGVVKYVATSNKARIPAFMVFVYFCAQLDGTSLASNSSASARVISRRVLCGCAVRSTNVCFHVDVFRASIVDKYIVIRNVSSEIRTPEFTISDKNFENRHRILGCVLPAVTALAGSKTRKQRFCIAGVISIRSLQWHSFQTR